MNPQSASKKTPVSWLHFEGFHLTSTLIQVAAVIFCVLLGAYELGSVGPTLTNIAEAQVCIEMAESDAEKTMSLMLSVEHVFGYRARIDAFFCLPSILPNCPLYPSDGNVATKVPAIDGILEEFVSFR